MVCEGASLYHFHRLKLLQTSLLCDLVLTLVSIVLKVSHVSDVAHITHLVAKVLEEFHEHVVGDSRTGVTEMCVTVNGRAADVKTNMSFVDRLENLFLSRKGIGYI
jgi:hypothetical protein